MHRLALLFLTIAAPVALGRLTYKEDVLVYAQRQPKEASQLAAVFDSALDSNRPVVLFIHGRGDEPEKSINGEGGLREFFGIAEGHAVRKLEKYGVTTILFSWDSVHGDGVDDRTRPLSKTLDAAEHLKTVLDALAASIDRHPGHPPITLLAHSMGNIVLQRYLESGPDSFHAREVLRDPLEEPRDLREVAQGSGHEVLRRRVPRLRESADSTRAALTEGQMPMDFHQTAEAAPRRITRPPRSSARNRYGSSAELLSKMNA